MTVHTITTLGPSDGTDEPVVPASLGAMAGDAFLSGANESTGVYVYPDDSYETYREAGHRGPRPPRMDLSSALRDADRRARGEEALRRMAERVGVPTEFRVQ